MLDVLTELMCSGRRLARQTKGRCMFLRDLEITNIRSIEHARLTFDDRDNQTRRWTLLVGENGFGKSAILRAIALVTAGSEALPELLGSPEQWVRNGQEHGSIRARLVTAEGETREIELSLYRGDSLRKLFQRNDATLTALDRALRHASRNYLCMGYGVTRRLASSDVHSMASGELFRNIRSRSVGTLFSPDATLHPLETWAIDLDAQARQAGLEVVRETLEGLLPGVHFREIDYENRRILFDTPDGVVPLSRLSEGYRNMAGWCGDLVYRLTEIYRNYRNPLTGRGLLLIDEVDLHLHPALQRRLRQFLLAKLPHLQIIATTNSPLTAQQCGAGELYVMQRLMLPAGPGPAMVVRFEGEPSRMPLPELLASPLFGLEPAPEPLPA